MEILWKTCYRYPTSRWLLPSSNAMQSREAARKHRTDIVAQGETIAALRQQQTSHQATLLTCPGCGANRHKGGRAQCPAYDQKCALCRKIGHFARVCRSKRQTNPPTTQASTNAIRIQSPEANHPQLYNIKEWQQRAGQAERLRETSRRVATQDYNRTAHSLPDIAVGSNVAVQHPRTKMWDTYGIVKRIGPNRQYHIQTKQGRMLIRNRRFIRRRVPASVPLQDGLPSPQSQPPLPRRSGRSRRPPSRLIEDTAWAD